MWHYPEEYRYDPITSIDSSHRMNLEAEKVGFALRPKITRDPRHLYDPESLTE